MAAKTKTYDFGYSGDWGGYANISMTGKLTCTLSEDLTTVTCWTDITSASFTPGTLSGSGFYNACGVMYNPPDWLSVPGRYHASGVYTTDSFPESYETYVGDVTDGIPNAFTDAVWGFYADDMNRGSGTFGDKHAYTYDVTGTVFDRFVLASWKRWFDHSGGVTPEPRAIVDAATLVNVKFTDIFPELADYYPGSRRKSGAWASLNQDAGGDHARASGAWKALKNREGDAYALDTGFGRKSDAWGKLPLQK